MGNTVFNCPLLGLQDRILCFNDSRFVFDRYKEVEIE